MVFKAIFWKEAKSLRKNLKAKVVMSIGTMFLIYFLLFIRLQTTSLSFKTYQNSVNYMTVIFGYIMFISNLRFWYEKNMKMLEILFILPAKLYTIIFAKIALPILISVLSSVFFYLLSLCFGFIAFEASVFSVKQLGQILLLNTFFQVCYSIINCYAMWCASLTYAKVIQFISIVLYMGSAFTLFALPTGFSLYDSLGTWIVMMILGIYALICYFRIDKEKAINTLSV